MKATTTLLLLSAGLLLLPSVLGFSPSRRTKRDLTCAAGGNRLCSYSCKARGYSGGACAWHTETAVYDCTCDTERRGVRCGKHSNFQR